jgi:DNA-binding transcriptional ArsR family regulator
MHALDVLGDPVRRRILELLADGDRTAGAIVATVGDEFGISQPAVSQHLRVLRERGFVDVRAEGRTRTYSVRLNALAEGAAWFRRFQPGQPNLDALATEIDRGKRQRRIAGEDARRDERPDDVRKDSA